MVLTKQEYRDLNLDLLLYKSELCNNKEDYVLRTADFNTEYRNSGYFARAYVYTNTKSGNTSIIFAHTVRNFEYIDSNSLKEIIKDAQDFVEVAIQVNIARGLRIKRKEHTGFGIGGFITQTLVAEKYGSFGIVFDSPNIKGTLMYSSQKERIDKKIIFRNAKTNINDNDVTNIEKRRIFGGFRVSNLKEERPMPTSSLSR